MAIYTLSAFTSALLVCVRASPDICAGSSSVNVDITEAQETDAANVALLQTSRRLRQSELEQPDEPPFPPGCEETLGAHGFSTTLSDEVLSRPFNFKDLLASRHVEANCRMTPKSERLCKIKYLNLDLEHHVLRPKYEPEDIVCLSPARTGSEAVSAALWAAGQPNFHNHDCSLADVVGSGAQRIIVSIRHPVARVVSGWQRYREVKPEVEETLGSLNGEIESIRNVSHPLHTVALRWTYGEFGMAFWMPLTYYLGGKDTQQFDNAVVKFVCTCNLDDDMAAAAAEWDLPLAEKDEVEQRNHTSAVSSDSEEAWASFMSEENIAWLKEMYAEDVALFDRECGHCEL